MAFRRSRVRSSPSPPIVGYTHQGISHYFCLYEERIEQGGSPIGELRPFCERLASARACRRNCCAGRSSRLLMSRINCFDKVGTDVLGRPHKIKRADDIRPYACKIHWYLVGVIINRPRIRRQIADIRFQTIGAPAAQYMNYAAGFPAAHIIRCLSSDSCRLNQYIPPACAAAAAAAAFAAAASSFLSATRLSVVSTIAATEAAFSSAERVTLVGSTMPASIISP